MTSQTSQLAVARTLLSVTLAATLTVATIYAVLACGDVGMGIAGGPPIYADYGLEVAQAIAATSAVLVLSWITLTVDTRLQLHSGIALVCSCLVALLIAGVAGWFSLVWADNNLGPESNAGTLEATMTFIALLAAPLVSSVQISVWAAVVASSRRKGPVSPTRQWAARLIPLAIVGVTALAYTAARASLQ